MPTFQLSFTVSLKDNTYDFAKHEGPLFHRWLPDGRDDCIKLNTNDAYSTLNIWFQRKGYLDDGYIKYDSERNEVDVNTLSQQAVLEAGPLNGLLTISNLIDDEIRVLNENKVGDEIFVRMAKRIVHQLLYPPVSNFINILKYNFGQYWIKDMEKWDSRFLDLGSYCRSLRMKWSLDDGHSWNNFIPTNREPERLRTLTIRLGGPYLNYITENDWDILKKLDVNYVPSLGLILLIKSHQLLENEEIRYALIEAVSSFEISLREYISKNLDGYDDISNFLHRMFREYDNRFNLAMLTAFQPEINIDDLKACIDVINYRNDLVHQGIDPPTDTSEKLKKLFRLIAKISFGPKIKFPRRNSGNAMMPEDKWNERYKKERKYLKDNI